MDLRVQRTRRSIVNAFIALRAKKPLNKITVKELAELAFINKATFYTHYKDIYDLSEQLEDEAIEQVLNAVSHTEYLITQPEAWVYELSMTIRSQNQLFSILFSPPRDNILIDRLEDKLRSRIHQMYPEFKGDLQKELLITVMIQGCFRAFLKHNDKDYDAMVQIIGDFNKCLISHCL